MKNLLLSLLLFATSANADVGVAGQGVDGVSIAPSSAGSGDVVGPSSAVDGEIVLFDLTTGKIVKRATGTGLVKSTSGVYSAATLLNADVNASAAIAHSKMAALTASRAMVTDGSGVAAASSVTATTLGYLDATSSIQTQIDGKLATGGNAVTATALAANPSDCSSDTYASTIAASGNLTCASITNASTTAASANTASAIVARDGSGNFSAGTISAALSGNATTATALASNPSDCSAGQYATAIAASGNLTCADPQSGSVFTISGHIETPTAKPFIVEQYAEYAYTINRITSQCDSGTADFDLEINGTNVTGCATQQMASSEAVDTCTAANSVAVGDTVSINVTAVSSPDDCRFTIKYTR